MRRAALIGLLSLLSYSFAAAGDATANAASPWRGMALADALERLMDESGLRLIYTDALVPDDLRVDVEPTATEPLARLRQLLAPHGLRAEAGPGSAWVVRRSDGTATLRGVVHRRGAAGAVAGARIAITGRDGTIATVSDADGAFEVQVPAGALSVVAEAAGFVRLEFQAEVAAGEIRRYDVALVPVPVSRDALTVSALGPRLPGDDPATARFGPDDLADFGGVAADPVRAVAVLPSAGGQELSAKPRARGSRPGEVMIRLDGLELVEPFHLKDFQGALSLLPAEVIGEAEWRAGGFPVETGDRLAGLLDLTSVEPRWARRVEMEVGTVAARLASSGVAARRLRPGSQPTAQPGGVRWLASGRLGLLNLPLELSDVRERPRFWDVFAKAEKGFGPSASLRGDLLTSEDVLELEAGDTGDDPADDDLRTRYQDAYLWGDLVQVLGGSSVLESRLAYSRFERLRTGLGTGGDESGASYDLRDRRILRVPSAAQTYRRLLVDGSEKGSGHELKAGWEARYQDVDYDYRNQRALDDPLAAIRDQPRVGVTEFDRAFTGMHWALWLADRWTFSRGSLEAGVRLDDNEALDDHTVDPRLDLVLALAPGRRLHVSWGACHQSQRLYELQVSDGETEFQRVERAENLVVGLAFDFDSAGRQRRGRWRPQTLRLDVYRRYSDRLRARWENLLDPVSTVPELEPDRVRVAPSSGLAEGIELFFTGRLGRRFDLTASASWARTEERIGDRWVPTAEDARWSALLDLRWRGPRGWAAGVTARAHDGWPITDVGARAVADVAGNGEELRIEPVLGPLRGERLSSYQRVDVVVDKSWRMRRGAWALRLAVQNAFSRRSARGYEAAFELDPSAPTGARVDLDPVRWAGAIPSLALRYTF